MDYHSQKATRCCAYAPAAPARQAFFSLLPPKAKLQFPGGSARSGLEVGSLEVTRATEADGVSSGGARPDAGVVGPARRAAGRPGTWL